MHRSRGAGWEKLLTFVVAAFYCGIVAYMVVSVATSATRELQLVKAGKKRETRPGVANLLRRLRQRG